MKSNIANHSKNVIAQQYADKMEAVGHRVPGCNSQQEVFSSHVFMDNFKSFQDSGTADEQHNLQEFEALRRNLEKQVNAIQKP